jgi:uncharacterized membrane protein YfcA
VTEVPFSTLFAAACVAAFVVGFLKTSIGGGIGLVLTSTLSIVLPPRVVLGLVAPLMNLSDPVTLRYYWRQWDGRQLRAMLPTLLAGIAVGTWLLTLLSETALRRAIGGVSLVFALIQLVVMWRARPLFGLDPHWSIGAAAGLGAGVASAIAHSGGAVMGLYLLALRLTPATIVATSSALVAVSNLLKLGAYWKIGFLGGGILGAALIASPFAVAGGWLGYRVNRWMPRRVFELVVIAVSIAGAIRLLVG